MTATNRSLSPERAKAICSAECGAFCCTGPRGLWLSPEEQHQFPESTVYQQRFDGSALLRFSDQPGGRCPNLGPENLCLIYEDRPNGCREFPQQQMVGCYLSGGWFARQYGQAFVGLPAGAMLTWEAATSTMNALVSGYAKGVVSGHLARQATRVDQNRNGLIKAFLESSAEHLVMLDSDMQFPEEVVGHLTRHGLPIVGGLYFHRGDSFPLVYRQVEDNPPLYKPMNEEVFAWLRSHDIDLAKDSGYLGDFGDSLIECDHVGTGSIAIRRDVLEALAYPWYETDGETMGDVNFQRKAKAAGFPVYADLAILSGHYVPHPTGMREFMAFWTKGHDDGLLKEIVGIGRQQPLEQEKQDA